MARLFFFCTNISALNFKLLSSELALKKDYMHDAETLLQCKCCACHWKIIHRRICECNCRFEKMFSLVEFILKYECLCVIVSSPILICHLICIHLCSCTSLGGRGIWNRYHLSNWRFYGETVHVFGPKRVIFGDFALRFQWMSPKHGML